MTTITRTCRSCGCHLSRYNTSDACAVCEPDYPTHSAFMLEHDPAISRTDPLVGPDVCKRGHDLLEHGHVRSGNGSYGRRCRVCDAMRQRARRERARLNRVRPD